MIRRRRRPVYEVVIIGGVIALAVVMGAALTKARAKAQKNDLLIDELQAIRTAVVTFKSTNNALPESLLDLTAKTFDAGNGEQRPYLEEFPAAGGGKWIDPFGNPYVYDPEKGWVRSSSPGHENW